jgi:hypothetical protein
VTARVEGLRVRVLEMRFEGAGLKVRSRVESEVEG